MTTVSLYKASKYLLLQTNIHNVFIVYILNAFINKTDALYTQFEGIQINNYLYRYVCEFCV